MASTTPPSPPKAQHSQLDIEVEKKEHDLSSSPSDGIESESEQVPELTPTAPAAGQEEQWVSGIKLFNIMAAITLVCVLVLLDTSIVVTAIPHITGQFHSLPDIGWYGGAYQLASCVALTCLQTD
jgi:hypothetical protein